MGTDLKISGIANILTDLIMITSADYVVQEANLAAKSVLGAGNSIVGTACHKIFRDRGEPCQDCPLGLAMTSGHVKSIQYFDKRFGEFFEERVQPILDANGELSKILITNRNVTEVRATEERSSHMKKLAAIGKLSSGAAHDFNNVIAGVLGRVHLIRKTKITPTLQKHLDSIEDAVKTGSETVRRMLEYAKGENSRTMEPLDVKNLLDTVVFITQPKWVNLREEKGIIVSLKTSIEENLFLRGNKSELTNAFTNLMINAVDAMPDGGVLKLTASRIEKQIRISVSDTGTGMTDDILERIFDPFFSTKGNKGTGLGLSEVFGTVRRHGAKIEVDSEVGKGTTFNIEINALDSLGVAADTDPEVLHKLNIVVVDDEEYLLETLQDILEEEGHTVQCFLDARDALKGLASDETYDMIITDFEMPEMDGREFAHRAKLLNPKIPIVLLSGWPIELSNDVDLADVVDTVLTKPFTLSDINKAFVLVLSKTLSNKSLD